MWQPTTEAVATRQLCQLGICGNPQLRLWQLGNCVNSASVATRQLCQLGICGNPQLRLWQPGNWATSKCGNPQLRLWQPGNWANAATRQLRLLRNCVNSATGQMRQLGNCGKSATVSTQHLWQPNYFISFHFFTSLYLSLSL